MQTINPLKENIFYLLLKFVKIWFYQMVFLFF